VPEAVPLAPAALEDVPTALYSPFALVKVMVCPTVRAVGAGIMLEDEEAVSASAVPVRGYPPKGALLFVAAIAGYARSSATNAMMDAPPIAAILAVFIFPQSTEP
jgi:hypothetical protein